MIFPLNMEESAQISYDVPMGMVHVGKDELKMRRVAGPGVALTAKSPKRFIPAKSRIS